MLSDDIVQTADWLRLHETAEGVCLTPGQAHALQLNIRRHATRAAELEAAQVPPHQRGANVVDLQQRRAAAQRIGAAGGDDGGDGGAA